MRALVFFVALVVGCAHAQSNETLVLDYQDFGPQVIARELIGMQWWQWQAHGDSRPVEYDVKVVVYRGVPLAQVEQKYPVDQEGKQDYRYVSYAKAIVYLDKHIAENVLNKTTERLRRTRAVILRRLGKPDQ